MPGSWGLKGKTREIAQAEYELSGMELEEKLLEINHAEDQEVLRLLKLALYRKHSKIDQYEYDQQKAKIQAGGQEQAEKIALLDVDLAHKKIDQQTYDRQRADILDEPWVSIPKVSWDPVSTTKTFFEIDYNDAFVKYLQSNGYQGGEEEIINRWLNDVCLSIASEMDVTADFIQNRSKRLDNGLTEHT
jgi:hypothetical protein